MTAQEIITIIEKEYNSAELIYEEMFNRFNNTFNFHFLTVPMKKESILYRARYSTKMDSFQKTSEITYPHEDLVTNFSRLNRPHQSLFYASESKIACVKEMLPYWMDNFEIDDLIKVTMSTWTLEKDIKLLIIPDTKNENEFNKSIVSDMSPEETKLWDYFSEKFKTNTKEDKNIYEFTSAFGNAMWLNSKRIDLNPEGFIYSSVQSKENVNIALSTEVIDSKIVKPKTLFEAVFQMKGYNESGVPIYIITDHNRDGLIIENEPNIKWIGV